jgi:hypothetical protein
MPDSLDAHNCHGLLLRDNGRFDEALAALDRAIACDRDAPEPHINRGLVLLLLGRWEQAWPEHEWRLRSSEMARYDRTLRGPAWDGRDLAGRTILLYTEQGFGDAIQFIRFLPMVADRGGRIVLDCQPALRRLFAAVPNVHELVTWDAPAPPYDVHCSLLSLPAIAHTTPQTISPPLPDFAHQFQSSDLAPRPLRVGLAWAGNPAHRDDRRRSIPFAQLAPLLRVPGIEFHNLQLDDPAKDVIASPVSIRDHSGHLTDFADTAAVVAQLDLVITVDTAVAHLAGTLGKPTWLLLAAVPDWRWLLDRDDSPWYPTMRLFRQRRAGDWAEVIQRVAHELLRLATSP